MAQVLSPLMVAPGECLTPMVLTLGSLKEPSVQSDYWSLRRVSNVQGKGHRLPAMIYRRSLRFVYAVKIVRSDSFWE